MMILMVCLIDITIVTDHSADDFFRSAVLRTQRQ
jgi:hypothetical protein